MAAEGGSITLEGRRDASGAWWFRVCTDESALGELGGEEPDGAPPWESWDIALEHLNQYPWPQLSPIGVHAEFAEAILDAIALHERGGAEQATRWRELLAMRKP